MGSVVESTRSFPEAPATGRRIKVRGKIWQDTPSRRFHVELALQKMRNMGWDVPPYVTSP